MKICYDISQTGQGKAGCGYFAHEMLTHMIDLREGLFFQLETNFGTDFFDKKNWDKEQYVSPNLTYGQKIKAITEVEEFWNNDNLGSSLGFPDIIHSNNFWCPPAIGGKTKIVYTLYDLSFFIEPAWTTEANRNICASGVLSAIQNADMFVAISENSKSNFHEFFPNVSDEKVRVIYPSSRFTGMTSGGIKPSKLRNIESRDFWLCVGTIEPRKNQKMLLEAYATYITACADPKPLVFAGGKGWLMDDFSDQINKLELNANVIQAGYVTDDELIWLYKNCFANIYPSLFEGFGLPVLEGMSCGAATITGNNSSIPEVSGDAAISLNPYTISDWSEVLCHLTDNPNQVEKMRNDSLIQSAKFSWLKSANELCDLYEEIS